MPAYHRSFKNLNNIKQSFIVVMLALIDTRITKLLVKHEQIHIYQVIKAQNTNIGTVPKTLISKVILILQEDGRLKW
jgi:hypothetical protein